MMDVSKLICGMGISIKALNLQRYTESHRVRCSKPISIESSTEEPAVSSEMVVEVTASGLQDCRGQGQPRRVVADADRAK